MVQRKSKKSKEVVDDVRNGFVNGHIKDRKTAIHNDEDGDNEENELVPPKKGELAAAVLVNGSSSAKRERKRTLSSSQQTLGERKAASQSTSKANDGQTESQAILLSQGLMANDPVKIDAVLTKSDSALIQATLSELPVVQVIPLLRAIEHRLRTGGSADIRPFIRWGQQCISTHLSYLSSQPELSSTLVGLLSWMRARTSQMQRLLTLHGKLTLLAEQLKPKSARSGFSPGTALHVFQNDDEGLSSDELLDSSAEEDNDSAEDDWWDEGAVDDEDEDDMDDQDSDAESSGTEEGDNAENGEEDSEEDDDAMEV